jgi:hypothetical protein
VAHYVAIFLAKHLVWAQTGADAGGLWIGPQASHDPKDLIGELNPNGECRCGSGQRYSDCCQALDRHCAEVERLDALRRAELTGQLSASYRANLAQRRHHEA